MKKGFGIFFIVIGLLNFFVGIAGTGSQYQEQATTKIFIGVGLLVLGIWMVNSSKAVK